MKRYYTYILFIVCTLLLASCQKDFDGILNAEIQNYQSDSKVWVDDSRYANWNDGDEVKVNGTDCVVKFVDGNKAQIKTTIQTTQETSFSAIYPKEYYRSSNTIELPASQSYESKDGKQLLKAPMAAFTTSETLKFFNVCSLLKITIKCDGTARTLTGIEVEDANSNLYGKVTFTQTENAKPQNIAISGGGKKVTLTIPNILISANGSKDFYIVVPPVASPKLTIRTIYLDGNGFTNVYTRKMKTNVSPAPTIGSNELIRITNDFDLQKGTNVILDTWSGDGTADSPFLITSDREFNLLVSRSATENFAGKFFKQTVSNISMGSDYKGVNDFRGNYNGDNKTITISGNAKNGVFKSLGNGATVRNLKAVVDLSSTGNAGGITNRIVLDANTKATISNCSVSGTIDAPGSSAGGICGSVSCSTGSDYTDIKPNFVSCVNSATVKGKNVGGIAGYLQTGTSTLTNCVNHGNVITTNAGGGFVGVSYWSRRANFSVNNSYSDGSISGTILDGTDGNQGGIGGVVGKVGVTQGEKYYLNNVYIAGSVSTTTTNEHKDKCNWVVGRTTSAHFIGSNVFRPSEGGPENDSDVSNYISGVEKYNKTLWKVIDTDVLIKDRLNTGRSSHSDWEVWKTRTSSNQPQLNFENL